MGRRALAYGGGGGGGGGGGSDSLELHKVVQSIAAVGSANSAAGNYTYGAKFQVEEEYQIPGVTIYTGRTGAHTKRVKIWIGGVAVKSQDFAMTGRGLFELSFTTPYVVLPGDLGVDITASYWDTDGAEYTRANAAALATPLSLTNSRRGPGFLWVAMNLYTAGDAEPVSSDASGVATIEPRLEAA